MLTNKEDGLTQSVAAAGSHPRQVIVSMHDITTQIELDPNFSGDFLIPRR